MKETITALISEEEIKKRISKLADEIEKSFNYEPLTVICVLKGGVVLAIDLIRHMKKSVELDFVELSSYGDSMESVGKVTVKKDISVPIKGKNVLIVEDIIDSGRTMDFLVNRLKREMPKSVKICTLLNKEQQRKFDIKADFIGFDIPDKFVVGYGLDYAQKYRNLPYIGTLSIEK